MLIITLVSLLKCTVDKDTVCNCINNTIEESKYCSEGMKKNFIVTAKEDNEDFKNSTKCWICDNDYVGN